MSLTTISAIKIIIFKEKMELEVQTFSDIKLLSLLLLIFSFTLDRGWHCVCARSGIEMNSGMTNSVVTACCNCLMNLK